MDQDTKIKDFESDYIRLFPQYDSFDAVREWKKEGDTISEFTLFEDYPPSYSSCNTVMLS